MSYYIWWQSQSDSERILQLDNDQPNWWDLPEWLVKQCISRYGRPGRGRLWVANHIKLDEIEWDDSKIPQAKWAENAGGIVFDAEYLPTVLSLPGFVTDLELNLATLP